MKTLLEQYLKKYQAFPPQFKATVWYFVCNVLQKGISVICVPLYTRLLTTEQYGSYQVFLSWLDIFEIITTFRLSWGGYTVGLTKFSDQRDRYSSSMQCMSITITSFFFLLYLIFADQINRITCMTTEMTVLIFVLSFAIPAIEFWTVRQRVEYRYHTVVAATLTMSILIPAFSLCVLIFTNLGEMGVIFSRVFVQGLAGIILLSINCSKKFTYFDRTFWGRAIRFNLPLIPYYLSTVILSSSDRIVIERLVGKDKAGIYGVAYSASMVMHLLNSAFTSSLQPWLFQHMKKEEYDGLSKTINTSLLMVAAANLALIALAPEAIALLAPSAYHEAIHVVPPLASSVVVMFFYQQFINIEFYYEKSKMITVASIGSALLNLALNIWLIPIFGYLAAGYTTLLSYMVFAVGHYIFMRHILVLENCPHPIVNIGSMLLILAGFFILSVILTIGYGFAPLRYMLLLVIIIIVWSKRDRWSKKI